MLRPERRCVMPLVSIRVDQAGAVWSIMKYVPHDNACYRFSLAMVSCDINVGLKMEAVPNGINSGGTFLNVRRR